MTAPATQQLFESLAALGLTSEYVRRFLPTWVSEQALDDASLLPELKLAIARRFGLDVQALLPDRSEARWRRHVPARYKRSLRADVARLDLATSIAMSAAEVATAAADREYTRPPSSGLEVRNHILERYGARFLSLGALLLFCWDSGIPVLFVSDLPKNTMKMDAMTASHNGRPAIVIAKSVRYSAWLSFILAHELAHIALGHVSDEDILVDAEISERSYLLDDDDLDERAADSFAIELLNGAADRRYESNRRFNPRELANAAMEVQRKDKTDAGHVILNYGHTMKSWDVALAALNLLDTQDARLLLQGAVRERIRSDDLAPDSLDYLLQIAGGQAQAS